MDYYCEIGSAAQSSLLPLLDIALGVSHQESKSFNFLQEMREYMIKPHREFLKHVEVSGRVDALCVCVCALLCMI